MGFEELLLILFILFPLLQRFFGKKPEPEPADEYEPIDHLDRSYDEDRYEKAPVATEPPTAHRRQPEPSREPVPRPAPQAEDDSLAEALRQIRQALGQPEAPAAKPKPPKPAPPEPAVPPVLEQNRAPRREPAPPIPALMANSVTADEIKGTSAIRANTTAAPQRSSELDRLVRSLRTEKGAREAFVMREILDRPKSMRRR